MSYFNILFVSECVREIFEIKLEFSRAVLFVGSIFAILAVISDFFAACVDLLTGCFSSTEKEKKHLGFFKSAKIRPEDLDCTSDSRLPMAFVG